MGLRPGGRARGVLLIGALLSVLAMVVVMIVATVRDDGPAAPPTTTLPVGGTLRLGLVGAAVPVDPATAVGHRPGGGDGRRPVVGAPHRHRPRHGGAGARLWPSRGRPRADQTRFTFHLRPDATFSDGTPITSTDVAATLARVAALGATSLTAERLATVVGFADAASGLARRGRHARSRDRRRSPSPPRWPTSRRSSRPPASGSCRRPPPAVNGRRSPGPPAAPTPSSRRTPSVLVLRRAPGHLHRGGAPRRRRGAPLRHRRGRGRGLQRRLARRGAPPGRHGHRAGPPRHRRGPGEPRRRPVVDRRRHHRPRPVVGRAAARPRPRRRPRRHRHRRPARPSAARRAAPSPGPGRCRPGLWRRLHRRSRGHHGGGGGHALPGGPPTLLLDTPDSPGPSASMAAFALVAGVGRHPLHHPHEDRRRVPRPGAHRRSPAVLVRVGRRGRHPRGLPPGAVPHRLARQRHRSGLARGRCRHPGRAGHRRPVRAGLPVGRGRAAGARPHAGRARSPRPRTPPRCRRRCRGSCSASTAASPSTGSGWPAS